MMEMLGVDELGGLSVAAARRRDLIDDIAEVTGLKSGVVRRRLKAAHGKQLVRNCFAPHWPAGEEEELSMEELGALRVADARRKDLAEQLAKVTGLAPSSVRRRLTRAHGRTLLINCFADLWPDDERQLLDANVLATYNVADARRMGLVKDLAAVTDLSDGAVRRRLDEAHGRTLLINCFEDRWPEPLSAAELAEFNVAEARRSNIAVDIAHVTGLSERKVRRRLEESHGSTLLINCFAAEWPEEQETPLLDAKELALLNVSEARERNLAEDLAEATDLSISVVEKRLQAAHGRMLLRNCFEDDWPELLGPDELSPLRVADAREQNLVEDIAAITGLATDAVADELHRAHGRMLLRNLFSDNWPEFENEDEEWEEPDEQEPDLYLADLNVADARRRGLAEQLAEGTGLRLKEVERRLASAHGRMLLGNCFEELWLDDDDDDDDDDDADDAGSLPGHSTEAPRAVETGRVIQSRYELVACLGKGGFGQVYEARDLKFPRRAIVLKLPVDDDPLSIEALHREFDLTHRLKHRHICSYHHYGEDSGLPFLVMEYGGESLESIIEAEGKIDGPRAIAIVTQAAEALDHVHACGEVHADVSPGNILVNGHGEVRLTDFGISARTEPKQTPGGNYTRMATRYHGWHPIYRAPEAPPARTKSDQYSLALVLCSMLRGEVFVERYRFEPFPHLSSSQNEAVARALAEHAEDRFPSCGEFARALEEGE